MDKTGTPADKAQQMSGPEVENVPIIPTESPVGSNDVFKSAVESHLVDREAKARVDQEQRSQGNSKSRARGGGGVRPMIFF